jgi:hypothetical protein
LILPFADDLDSKRIHVQAASNIIFLCGGRYSKVSDPTPLSIRDALLKIVANNPIPSDRTVILAEEITSEISLYSKYDDILEFETDIAQIVELIILFCESEGTLSELGAFAMIHEIASRLFVIVRQKHWDEDSFIKLGPLRRIEKKYSRDAIFVIEDDDIGMRGDSAALVDKSALKDLLTEPIALQLTRPNGPSTFNRESAGHLIKLIVGLIQEYGALLLDEIVELLAVLAITKTPRDVERYLFCAQAAGWLKKVSKGSNDYYAAAVTKLDAAIIHSKEDAEVKNKQRRRALIREHWVKHDAERNKAIKQVLSGAAL